MWTLYDDKGYGTLGISETDYYNWFVKRNEIHITYL